MDSSRCQCRPERPRMASWCRFPLGCQKRCSVPALYPASPGGDVLLPAIAEAVVVVIKRLLAAALVRSPEPVEIVVRVCPIPVQQVIGGQNIAVRGVSQRETVN